MKLKLLTLLFGMALITNVFSQTKEPALTIQLLANDKIADVNIKQEIFVKSLGNIIDYCKSNFNNISDKQKIGILVIAHKTGTPTYECHSNPRIDPQWQGKILKELGDIQIENTHLVDFPIFISINSKYDEATTDFADYEDPVKKQYSEYENADLQTKLRLVKEYATTHVLPVLSSYQVIVDDQFEGVKSFGKLIQSTNFTQAQDVDKLTSANENYWRATSEMSIGNQLIPLTKISVLVSQGEIDYAQKFIEIISMFSDPETITNHYLNEISYRVNLINQELNKRIESGIAEHDKGNYKNAIAIYDDILKIHPNSAWTLYEKYFSENAKKLADNKAAIDDRTDWDNAKVEIFKHNPLYHLDVRANNGREAYLIFRRMEINNLFKKKDEKIKDVFKYAEISVDLGVYDFAAQLFWLTATFDKEAFQTSLNNYLYCLDKLGETKLKSNFKGDFAKIFKSIDERRTKEMKNSNAYKAMKN